MKKTRKGQAAMEYLMTYGWAILIVIIVAAALYLLGIFNPATYQGATATGFSGFNVPTGGWSLAATGGTLTLKIANGQGATILLTSGLTDTFATYAGTSCQLTVPSTPVAPNGAIDLTTNCGAAPSSWAPTAGASYTVPVTISYTFVDTNVAGRSTGTLTGTVV